MYVQDFDITATYTDASGEVKLHTVKTSDLSSSWVIEKNYEDHVQTNAELVTPLCFLVIDVKEQ